MHTTLLGLMLISHLFMLMLALPHKSENDNLALALANNDDLQVKGVLRLANGQRVLVVEDTGKSKNRANKVAKKGAGNANQQNQVRNQKQAAKQTVNQNQNQASKRIVNQNQNQAAKQTVNQNHSGNVQNKVATNSGAVVANPNANPQTKNDTQGQGPPLKEPKVVVRKRFNKIL